MPELTRLLRAGNSWIWRPNPPYGKACDKCGKEIKDGDPAWLRCHKDQDWSYHIGCQPWGYPFKGAPLWKRWYWKLKIRFRKMLPKPSPKLEGRYDLDVRVNVSIKPEDWNDVQVSKREPFVIPEDEIKGRPWPGFCQKCKAPLDPPDRTDCPTCFASDEDE